MSAIWFMAQQGLHASLVGRQRFNRRGGRGGGVGIPNRVSFYHNGSGLGTLYRVSFHQDGGKGTYLKRVCHEIFDLHSFS